MTEWMLGIDSIVVKEVEKYLGGRVKVPRSPTAADLMAKVESSGDKFKKIWTDINNQAEKASGPYGKVISALQNTVKDLKSENFGLDPKNKDDVKKIEKARSLYIMPLTELLKEYEKRLKESKDVDASKPVTVGTADPLA